MILLPSGPGIFFLNIDQRRLCTSTSGKILIFITYDVHWSAVHNVKEVIASKGKARDARELVTAIVWACMYKSSSTKVVGEKGKV